jgi:hypothetical protein
MNEDYEIPMHPIYWVLLPIGIFVIVIACAAVM